MYRWILYLYCPLGEDPLEDPEWPEMDQDEPAVPADESEE